MRALPIDPRSLASHRELLGCGPYDWALVPADNRWSWVARAMGARWITAFAGGPGGSKDWPVDEHVEWPMTAEAWGDIASRSWRRARNRRRSSLANGRRRHARPRFLHCRQHLTR